MKGFGVGLIIGVGITLGLTYLFKHRIVAWYAERYPEQLGKKIEEGFETWLPEIDIKVGGESGLSPKPPVRYIPGFLGSKERKYYTSLN